MKVAISNCVACLFYFSWIDALAVGWLNHAMVEMYMVETGMLLSPPACSLKVDIGEGRKEGRKLANLPLAANLEAKFLLFMNGSTRVLFLASDAWQNVT